MIKLYYPEKKQVTCYVGAFGRVSTKLEEAEIRAVIDYLSTSGWEFLVPGERTTIAKFLVNNTGYAEHLINELKRGRNG